MKTATQAVKSRNSSRSCDANRYEKRHSNVAAHVSPCFRVSDGDTVIIGQCRCAVYVLTALA
jgi:ribosomal protein S17